MKHLSPSLVGTFKVIAQVAARCRVIDVADKERGVIVNTAVVAAYDGQMGQAAYAASNGVVAVMTLPIDRDPAQLRIRSSIAPGIFLTPMLTGSCRSRKSYLASRFRTQVASVILTITRRLSEASSPSYAER